MVQRPVSVERRPVRTAPCRTWETTGPAGTTAWRDSSAAPPAAPWGLPSLPPRAPVFVSHANPSRFSSNSRNIDDEQINARVPGATSWALCRGAGQQTWPTLDQLVAIVDGGVPMVGGAAHIGIGTDMSLGTHPVHGLEPPRPAITRS